MNTLKIFILLLLITVLDSCSPSVKKVQSPSPSNNEGKLQVNSTRDYINGSNQDSFSFRLCIDSLSIYKTKRLEKKYKYESWLDDVVTVNNHKFITRQECIDWCFNEIQKGDKDIQARLFLIMADEYQRSLDGDFFSGVITYFGWNLPKIPSSESFEFAMRMGQENYVADGREEHMGYEHVGVDRILKYAMPMIDQGTEQKYDNLYLQLLEGGLDTSEDDGSLEKYLNEVMHPTLYNTIQSDWKAGKIKLKEIDHNKSK